MKMQSFLFPVLAALVFAGCGESQSTTGESRPNSKVDALQERKLAEMRARQEDLLSRAETPAPDAELDPALEAKAAEIEEAFAVAKAIVEEYKSHGGEGFCSKNQSTSSSAINGISVATVTKTFSVKNPDGSEWYVRLLECNTPESGAAERVGYAKETEYGKKASDYTKSLVSPGDVVFLSRDLDKDDGVSSDLDRYGRLLRVVWLSEPKDNWNTDEEMVSMHTLNGRLLTSGMAEAVFYDDRGYEDLFTRLESGAREKKAGLWAYEGAFERES